MTLGMLGVALTTGSNTEATGFWIRETFGILMFVLPKSSEVSTAEVEVFGWHFWLVSSVCTESEPIHSPVSSMLLIGFMI